MPKRYNSMHILYLIHVFLVIMIKNKFLFDHIRFSHCLQFDLTVIERIQRYSSILASKVSLSELIFIIWKSYTCVVIQMKPYFYVACVQEGTSVHRLIFMLQDKIWHPLILFWTLKNEHYDIWESCWGEEHYIQWKLL